ncbi:MAG: hypothetical protein JNM04_02905 [Chthonomonas sp.]|nr:hypothetical protein [Chthonomonas sp.]
MSSWRSRLRRPQSPRCWSARQKRTESKALSPHRTAYVGYLISHETHHRAQAELILREFGAALPDKVAYGLWEWGVR